MWHVYSENVRGLWGESSVNTSGDHVRYIPCLLQAALVQRLRQFNLTQPLEQLGHRSQQFQSKIRFAGVELCRFDDPIPNVFLPHGEHPDIRPVSESAAVAEKLFMIRLIPKSTMNIKKNTVLILQTVDLEKPATQ